jgi:hypothetical protein
MNFKQVIEESKSYFGVDRTKLKEKILSFDFNGKEYKEWRQLLKATTKQPFDINYGIFDDLIENLKENNLDDIDWNWTGDLSWEFKILLNQGVDKGLDWDKRLTYKCNGTARILQVYVSDILPCYAIDTYYLAFNKKEDYYEFGPIEIHSENETKELKRIKDLLDSKGYLYLNQKASLKKYKDLYSDCNSDGGACLFDVLFSDTENYQTDYLRFNDKMLKDKTDKKITWREYYEKGKTLIKRMEYRYFPSKNVLLITTDKEGRIIEVKVWRDIDGQLHREFTLDILKEQKKETITRAKKT